MPRAVDEVGRSGRRAGARANLSRLIVTVICGARRQLKVLAGPV